MFERLRVIIDAPTDGPRNMAIDEVLLQAVGHKLAGPTLRLYRWQQATLSLGYFQRLSSLADQPLIVQSLPLVRRPTGGGAIIHDRELTYCLALPVDDCSSALAEAFGLGGKAVDMYGRMHGYLNQAVERLGRQGAAAAATSGDHAPKASVKHGQAKDGLAMAPGRGSASSGHGQPNSGLAMAPGSLPVAQTPHGRDAFLCFQRHSPLDLMVGGDKLAGSSQRRTKHGLIQHGSLVLRSHPAQPSQAVERITGRNITFEEMASELLNVLRAAQVELEHGQLSHDESLLLPALLDKHKSQEWLAR